MIDGEITTYLNEFEELYAEQGLVCKTPELYGLKHREILAAAKQGDLIALRNFAVLVFKGDGVPKDISNAGQIFYILFNYPGNGDDLISKYYYARILGMEGYNERGLEILNELEALKFIPAIALKGNLYHFGQMGVKRSFDDAKRYYFKAHEVGHYPSTALLGKLYLDSSGVINKFKGLIYYLRAIFSRKDKQLGSLRDVF